MRRGLALIWAAGMLAAACGEPLPPTPAQPVAFSHKLHVTDNQIGCTACHAYAMHGPVAGVPSLASCIGCHKFVDKDKADVQLLAKAFEEGKPVVWNRVNRVPDHVYFSHQRHVLSGVECKQCHGDVAQMDTDHPVQAFSMGFCVECHRGHSGPADCIACHK